MKRTAQVVLALCFAVLLAHTAAGLTAPQMAVEEGALVLHVPNGKPITVRSKWKERGILFLLL